jgi:hypothetical protein
MSTKSYVRIFLLCALVSLYLGGLLLHLRIHPLGERPSNVVPFLAAILGVLVVPWLFSSRKLVEYGYVLNGMLVIIGTITMTHFSIVHWPAPSGFGTILLKTMLADILLLWGNFFVGKSLFELEVYGYDPNRERRGKTYRYPNLGWWIVHLAAISAVYTIGHALWR